MAIRQQVRHSRASCHLLAQVFKTTLMTCRGLENRNLQPAPKYHTKECSHSPADSPGARTWFFVAFEPFLGVEFRASIARTPFCAILWRSPKSCAYASNTMLFMHLLTCNRRLSSCPWSDHSAPLSIDSTSWCPKILWKTSLLPKELILPSLISDRCLATLGSGSPQKVFLWGRIWLVLTVLRQASGPAQEA